MRKFLISAALLGSGVAIASPAAAQWAPQPQAYGYQNGYQNGYGYQNNYGAVRSYQARIQRAHQQIHQLGNSRRLSRGEFMQLNRQVDQLEARLSYAARRGLNRGEAYNIERGLAQLERNIQRQASYGYGYNDHHGNQYGYNQYGNGQYGYQNGYAQIRNDQDRDGRDDRYEDDRGSEHDD
ncbi:MAG: hypothetical protein ABIR51_02075 [Sphingomicrobium sp.]